MKNERLKTDLITNVSHDIKTPLTSIINYIDLMKRENIQDPKIQSYLEVLEAKAQRLKTLTRRRGGGIQGQQRQRSAELYEAEPDGNDPADQRRICREI